MTNKKDYKYLIDLVALLVFCMWLFLLIIPFVFNFNSAPIVGKVFMIIGSIFFLLMYIFFVVGIELINKKDKRENKKNIWTSRIIFLFVLAFYILGLTRYFSIKLNSIYAISITVIIFIGIFWQAYELINKHRKLVNNERISVIILTAALFVLIVGLMCLGAENDLYLVLIKVAIGIFYVFLISIFLNFIVLNNKSALNEKHKIILIAFFIALGMAVLISFPFYIQWWGLSGDKFNTFVTTYSAIVGGALTLVGVAWTIRKTDSVRNIDALNAAKPYLQYLNIHNQTLQVDLKMGLSFYVKGEGCLEILNIMLIKNLGGTFIFLGIEFDDKFKICRHTMIGANGIVELKFNLSIKDLTKSQIKFIIYGYDIYNNYYAFNVYNTVKVNNNSQVSFIVDSIGLPQLVSRDEMKKIQEKGIKD